ncbi:MAG TPA: P-II family nitrogen regulator [Fimbriimonadaceae bacterium]|nr:P-II family nitrogen regulator [Fimbriimonadaceae bacterium]
MVRVIAFIRPHQLEAAKTAIAAVGVGGLNVTDCKGRGNSQEREQRFMTEVDVLRMRSRIEVVCSDDLKDEVVGAILDSVRTGQPGDGKIFVEKILEAVRIRTGERGNAAI